MNAEILKPVAVLILWTLVMLVWMMIARAPAMKKVGIDIRKVVGGRPNALDGVVDEKAQWPAHNYIHLLEQPTLFYAVTLLIAVSGNGDGYTACVAWAYTALRIVHSIWQATINRVIIRFYLFALSTLALLALALKAVLIVFAV